MKRGMKRVAQGAAVLAVLWVNHCATASANDDLVTLVANPGNVVMPSVTYNGWNYSTLDQINLHNIENYQITWTWEIGTLHTREAPPLVVGDTMYIVSPNPNYVYALDLNTDGTIKWEFRPDMNLGTATRRACCGAQTRGLNYAEGKIFFNTLDGQFFGLDAETGDALWRTVGADLPLTDLTVVDGISLYRTIYYTGGIFDPCHIQLRRLPSGIYSPTEGILFTPNPEACINDPLETSRRLNALAQTLETYEWRSPASDGLPGDRTWAVPCRLGGVVYPGNGIIANTAAQHYAETIEGLGTRAGLLRNSLLNYTQPDVLDSVTRRFDGQFGSPFFALAGVGDTLGSFNTLLAEPCPGSGSEGIGGPNGVMAPFGTPLPGQSCDTCAVSSPGFTGGVVGTAVAMASPGGVSPALSALNDRVNSDDAQEFVALCEAAVTQLLADAPPLPRTTPSITDLVLRRDLVESPYPACRNAATGGIEGCRQVLANYDRNCLSNPNTAAAHAGVILEATPLGPISQPADAILQPPTVMAALPMPSGMPTEIESTIAFIGTVTGILFQPPTTDFHPSIFCTATRVSREWVLTAAHCMRGLNKDDIRVIRDPRDIEFRVFSPNDGEPEVVTFESMRLAQGHPGLGRDSLENDYVLLRVSQPHTAPPVALIGDAAQWDRVLLFSFQFIAFLEDKLASILVGRPFSSDADLVQSGKWRDFVRFDASPGCYVQSSPTDALIRHGCPTDWLSSGAPIFRINSEGAAPMLVGVHTRGVTTATQGTCFEQGCDGMFNIGVRLSATDRSLVTAAN